jgi:hypothetical protein
MFTVDGSKTIAWWQFDGKTGEPVAVSENGRHQATTEYANVEELVEFAVREAYVFLISVVVGFVIGFGAIVAAELECMSDPVCRKMDEKTQRIFICDSAFVIADKVCVLYSTIIFNKFIDLKILPGFLHALTALKGCRRGAHALLRIIGC